MTLYRKGRGPYFAPIPWELQDNPSAKAFHIATYAALKRFADFGSDEGATVSDATVAEKAGCSERQVRYCRDDLEAWGWLEWETITTRFGRLNAYIVHSSTPASGANSEAREAEKPAHGAKRKAGGVRHTVPDGSGTIDRTGPAHGAGNREPETESHLPRSPVAPKGGGSETLELAIEDQHDDPPTWMHAAWRSGFENGREIKLTKKRAQKYRAMYEEQLKGTPNPQLAWTAILHALKNSKHHTSDPTWVFPESFLLNEERRDQWVERAVVIIEKARTKSEGAKDFAAYYRERYGEAAS